jgi:hypothetical protein
MPLCQHQFASTLLKQRAQAKMPPFSHQALICANAKVKQNAQGPDIFRGNCPLGDFKGRYAGRISRQNWKSLIFSRCGDYTWVGKGYFFTTGEKIKDFQFCLPILPAYLPLKFPNGQFPLKTEEHP